MQTVTVLQYECYSLPLRCLKPEIGRTLILQPLRRATIAHTMSKSSSLIFLENTSDYHELENFIRVLLATLIRRNERRPFADRTLNLI
jgi:hypothetical protein